MEAPALRRAGAVDASALTDLTRRAYGPYLARLRGRRPAPMDADLAAATTRDVVWVAELDRRHDQGFDRVFLEKSLRPPAPRG